MKTINRSRNIAMAFLICIAMLLAMMPQTAEKAYADNIIESGSCGDNMRWEYDAYKTLTISGTGNMYDYEYEQYDPNNPDFKGPPWSAYFDEIEKIVVNEGVTGIGNYAFTCMFKPAKMLSEVILPSGLLRIGDSSFYECGIDDSVQELKVTLPDTLTYMGETAFASSKIKRISIPAGVKRLNRTFDSCAHLEQIDLGQIEEIGEFTFLKCTSLENISLPTTLKSIEEGAFMNSQISEIVIPEGVTSLGKYYADPGEYMPAFIFCENLKKIVIPSTVTQLSEQEFSRCDNLQEIDYQGTEEQWKELTKNLDVRNLPENLTIQFDYKYDPNPTPNPNPNPNPTPTPTPTPTPDPTPTPTPTPDPTPTPTPTPDPNKTPSVDPTPTPSVNPTPNTTPGTVTKKANPLKLKAKTAKIKYKKLRKKTQKLAVSKVIKFTKKGQGKLSYKLVSAKKGKKSFKKYFKINSKTGKVTVKKGRKKGTYLVTAKVKAAGNANYKASAWKTVRFKIKVR